ncbi:MAG: response regulator transcription factor [Gammaproteobacteria bacterium]|nr:response regulator transcription factor [Gammaproteobacteria bacterium]
MRVLVVDDNHDICQNIGDYLELYGHVVDFAYNGANALRLALIGEYDVIVLDLMLPGMDGLDVCRELRAGAKSEVPVLMLTARDTLTDKLGGFRAGTDDYLVKPFAMQELLARLQALYARRKGRLAQKLVVGDLALDKKTREVSRGGQRISLNPVGFKILERMMEASPTVVTRTELETLLWGDEWPESDALRSHLYKLRRAMEMPCRERLLHTVHGVGYRLAVPDD